MAIVKMRMALTAAGMVLMAALAGCQTTSVQRISAEETRDLSGCWNNTDSRLVSEEMIRGMMGAGWLVDFAAAKSRKPVVIVGEVRNLTSEHIDTGTFIKDIEREVINAGRVKFVASRQERDEVRSERSDQQSQATEETAKRLAAETGADFMLKGSIKTLLDAVQGKQVRFYQVDLELIDIQSNEKVWINTKKITKAVTQSRTRW
jgi:penicillin-binding protein activator